MGVMFVLPKGKPWSVQQTRQLIELRNNGKTVAEIANLMSKSADAIKQKLRRIGLKVVTVENTRGTTTFDEELILPNDLPSIEMVMLKLVAAMNALENPKLTKTDVMRLKTLIQTCKIYQKLFADYVGYRKIERDVKLAIEMFDQRKKERKQQTT